MARHPRLSLPGYTQHVIQRGNNQNVTFITQEDYQHYIVWLHDACERFSCSLHAYVCMNNHTHLLMTPSEPSAISKVMQSLGRVYVQYFNQRHYRTGTLWEGRYRATLIEADSYLLPCYRYIESNPVRAGAAQNPGHYPWSSYCHNALGDENTFITPHALYLALGDTPKARCAAYRALFDEQLPCDTIEAIRNATNKAWVLGHTQFQENIESITSRQAQPKPRGGDRRSSDKGDRGNVF